jgi:membrane dipeptidase
MKIFDAHTDILYDVYKRAKNNDLNRFRDYHYKQLKSNANGGIWTLYSPDEFNLIDALENTTKLIDFSEFDVILGLESLRNLKNISDLDIIYNLGVRHAMLTWNEENDYATGILGDISRGITLKGYEVLDYMIQKDMIIDLSHLNEKSFYDVLNYTNQNILVSHSNIYELCKHRRNLKDEQLLKLKEANGLLGLTLVGKFISNDLKNQTLDNFMEHLKYAINIMGIDNVCFGFDFMDYFDYSKTLNIEEVKSVNDIKKLIDIMFEHGFKKEEIEKITYYNIYNCFKKHIYKGENKNV